MQGPATFLNYIFSGKWQPGWGNRFAPFKNGETFEVAPSTVGPMPPELGPAMQGIKTFLRAATVHGMNFMAFGIAILAAGLIFSILNWIILFAARSRGRHISPIPLLGVAGVLLGMLLLMPRAPWTMPVAFLVALIVDPILPGLVLRVRR